METSRVKHFVNYFLTYFALAFSDISYFYSHRPWRAGFFVVLAAFFFIYKKKVGKEIIWVTFVTILIILVQWLMWSGKTFTILTFLVLVVYTPYLAIKVIGRDFLIYYRNILLVYTLISIAFWIGVNFIPGVFQLTRIMGYLIPFSSDFTKQSFILYNVEYYQFYGLYRNPGPFHEPGAFAVFLMLAISAEIFIKKKLITRNNIIFVAALVTTASTAGFLSLFVITGFYIFTSKQLTQASKLVILTGFFALSVFLFNELEFLSDKLSNQVEEQTSSRLHTETAGRFLGARKALVVLSRYPLFGRGLLSASQAGATSDEAAAYGWITWVSQIGLIAGILFLFFQYKALRNYSIVNLNNKSFALFAFIAQLGVLTGQDHTSHFIHFMMFYIPLIWSIGKDPQVYYLTDKK